MPTPSPQFTALLHRDLSALAPDEFVVRLESLLIEAGEHLDAWDVSRAELKLLVRRHCRAFAAQVGYPILGQGGYFPFLVWTYGASAAGREHLHQLLAQLARWRARLDDPSLDAGETTSQMVREWASLMRPDTPVASRPATQLLLWRVIESLIRGELEVHAVSVGNWASHYPRFAAPSDLAARRDEPRRAEILSNLRFTLGCASLRRPSLPRILGLGASGAGGLRAAVETTDPTVADPIAVLLKHQAEIVALAEPDLIGPFFEIVGGFLIHLADHVLPAANLPGGPRLAPYCRLLVDRYLPGLQNYCRILHQARTDCPFLGDLLAEPYLVRTRALDGDQEPSLAALLQSWHEVQEVIERRAKYDQSGAGAVFSFSAAYRAAISRAREREAARLPAAGDDRPRPGGRTSRGLPVVGIHDFDTLREIRLGTPGPGASRPDDDFGDAERFPLRLGSLDTLSAISTEELPAVLEDVEWGGAEPMDWIETEELPVTEEGEIDLRRVATLILPVMPEADPEPDEPGGDPAA